MGIQDINRVTEIKLRAERKAGQLLEGMERGQTGPKLSVAATDNSEYREAINDLEGMGTSESTALNWQSVAKLPEEVFEEVIEEHKAEHKELTTGKMRRTAAEHKRKKRAAEKKAAPPLPTDKYRIWYADTPDNGRIPTAFIF